MHSVFADSVKNNNDKINAISLCTARWCTYTYTYVYVRAHLRTHAHIFTKNTEAVTYCSARFYEDKRNAPRVFNRMKPAESVMLGRIFRTPGRKYKRLLSNTPRAPTVEKKIDKNGKNIYISNRSAHGRQYAHTNNIISSYI